MKNKKWQSVAVCSLVLLLIVSLSAGVVSLSLGGAAIVPATAASGGEASVRPLEADYSVSWEEAELDPTALYDLACRQTAFIRWDNKKLEEGKQTVFASGIIVSQDGYILTNAHCVSEARAAGDPIEVVLFDGRSFMGEIVGADPETDVALLKVAARGLSAAMLSTAKLKGCQTVYVMGHPDDELRYTMTSGIVSGLDRQVDFSDGASLHMFQIDAAVNPGNSGGPVYDDRGRVVGMVTAKYVSINTEGIGFAIPIQEAVSVAGELKEYGYVPGRPLMGITAITVEEGKLKAGSPAGVMVHSAEAGLPGEKAGLIKGDIIVAINGKTITSMEDLSRVKKDYRAGDTVKLRFWRDGEYLETYMTFDEVTPEHPTGPVDVEDDPFEEDGPSEWDPAPEDEEEETEENTEPAEEEEETPVEENS